MSTEHFSLLTKSFPFDIHLWLFGADWVWIDLSTKRLSNVMRMMSWVHLSSCHRSVKPNLRAPHFTYYLSVVFLTQVSIMYIINKHRTTITRWETPESLIWTPTFCHKGVINLVLHPFTCAVKPAHQNTLTPICPSAGELNGARSIYQMRRNATETQGEINSSEKLPAVFSHSPPRKRCRKSLSHQISERNQKPLQQRKEHWQMKTKCCDATQKWKHGKDVGAVSVLGYRTNSPADRREGEGSNATQFPYSVLLHHLCLEPEKQNVSSVFFF